MLYLDINDGHLHNTLSLANINGVHDPGVAEFSGKTTQWGSGDTPCFMDHSGLRDPQIKMVWIDSTPPLPIRERGKKHPSEVRLRIYTIYINPL